MQRRPGRAVAGRSRLRTLTHVVWGVAIALIAERLLKRAGRPELDREAAPLENSRLGAP